MANPTAAADKILSQLGIKSSAALQRLEDIAWTRGAEVRQAPLSGAEGRLIADRGKGIITISSTVSNRQRKRFSIAHELGHFEMHQYRSAFALFLCSSADINEGHAKDTINKLEREANEFAAALLLPGQLFQPLCDQKDPSLDHIAELAHKFDTSLTATALRYIRFTEEPVALVYTEDQYIKWVGRSTALRERQMFIDSRRRLHSTSMAARLSQERRHVHADIWFDNKKLDDDARIMEHSWHMPNYNAVLTLLWLDEDTTDEDDDWMF